MSSTEVSSDAPIDRSDREASTLGERFAGVDGTEIEDTTDYKLMKEFIERAFRKYLTPRERKILFLYYGLDESGEPMTLEKIGALMGVTRERIRQIRERAFEKLRESPMTRPRPRRILAGGLTGTPAARRRRTFGVTSCTRRGGRPFPAPPRPCRHPRAD